MTLLSAVCLTRNNLIEALSLVGMARRHRTFHIELRAEYVRIKVGQALFDEAT